MPPETDGRCSAKTDQAEDIPEMPAAVAEGSCDGLDASQPNDRQGEIAERRHDGRPVVFADLASVLVEGDVADIVDFVLDSPV